MLLLALMSLGLVSCNTTTGGGYVYTPSWYYNCYAVYDSWGYYLWDECYWEYYSADKELVAKSSKNIIKNANDKETALLNFAGEFYANKFNLSKESGLKIAKTLNDYNALQSRTSEDLANFASELYGTNPSDLLKAVSAAQRGNNTALKAQIADAAVVYDTDSETMEAIVEELSAKGLKELNIEL